MRRRGRVRGRQPAEPRSGSGRRPRGAGVAPSLERPRRKKAKAAIAYVSARNYLAHAAALAPEDAWTRLYELTFDLHLLLSECEYLVGNFAAADGLFDSILSKAQSDLDRAQVYGLRMKLYQVAGKYDDGSPSLSMPCGCSASPSRSPSGDPGRRRGRVP